MVWTGKNRHKFVSPELLRPVSGVRKCPFVIYRHTFCDDFVRHALTFRAPVTVCKPPEEWGITHMSDFCHFLFAATATGWSISGCWRGAASTASGKRPSAPSTVWWTSTELTASPWTKWSASETPPHHLSCGCSRDVTLIPIPIKTAPRNPYPQPTCTLTMRGTRLHVCWIRGYDKTPDGVVSSVAPFGSL